MDSSANAQRTGSPTFNLVNPGDNKFSEWPSNIPGLICKTAPFGYYSSQRFSQCCSGKVYNITAPTTPDDPAYPVSCALFCQVDSELNEINDKYPYGFSEHFMCLNDGHVLGGDDDAARGGGGAGEVVCATLTADNGEPMPTSYESSWTGDWQMRSYVRQEPGGLSWTWVEDGQTYTPATPATSSSSPEATSEDLSPETTSEGSVTTEGTTNITTTSVSSTDGENPAATTIGGDDPTDAARSMSSWALKSVLGFTIAVSLLTV